MGGVSGHVLFDGDAPLLPKFGDRATGLSLGVIGGVRFQPMASGVWADVGGGVAVTGSLVRASVEGHVGYDFAIGSSGSFALGPVLGYTYENQPHDNLRPEDAHIGWLGVHAAFGKRADEQRRVIEPKCADKDFDGLCDAEDLCPTEPPGENFDPKRKGCPRGDEDKDTIFDDEDACPTEAGVRSTDPKVNGCPRRDTDKDTVFDDEDVCPEEPGIRTEDPNTNGCPRRDDDQDLIFNDEDACPTVPGPRTDDPKTNGCPIAKDGIRIEGDIIVLDDVVQFDLDSPRVRQVSWKLVEKVAKFIQGTPAVLVVDIQGHADKSGDADHNQKLSNERADAVKKLLIKYGINKDRIQTHAFGEGKPRTKGENSTQNSKNRRVEFVIIKASKGAQTTSAPATLPKGGTAKEAASKAANTKNTSKADAAKSGAAKKSDAAKAAASTKGDKP